MIYANSWMKRVRICAVCVPMPPFGVYCLICWKQPMLRRMRKLELLGRARSSLCRATPQSWPIRPLKMMQRKTDMAFAISAFFPLGFYQGSDSGGRPESYPSPSRLYSALVSAAYLTFGFETPNADCGLTDEQIHAALDWLEGNPPQEILFPAKYRSIVRSSALAEFGIQHARAIDTQSRLASASIDWLDEKGVLACCLFNQFMSNNPSAPERWLEPGEIIPVRQME